jgi:SAM-dependent methyltransferase
MKVEQNFLSTAPKPVTVPWNEKLHDFPCDLCGRKEEEFLYIVRGTVTNYPFRLVRCRFCGLLYLNPRLNPTAISELYDRDYYEGKGFDKHVNYLNDLLRSDEDSKIVRPQETVRIIGELKPPPSTHLDFGCGIGDLMCRSSRYGYKSEGYEISQFARNFAARHGFTIYGCLDEIPSARYDVITAIEVLEHCSSPFDALRTIHRALKLGGIFYYTSCNFDGYYEQFRNGRTDPIRNAYVRPEGHIHFFSSAVMKLYFEKVGFVRSFVFEPHHYVKEGRLFDFLTRMHLIGKGSSPQGVIQKAAYFGGRGLAIMLGIRKASLPLAQK